MYTVFLLFLGCASEASSPPPEGPPGLVIEVVARVGEASAPAAWSARVTWGELRALERLRPGVCRKPEDRARPAETVELASVTLTGPIDAPLVFDEGVRAYVAAGPRQVLDPAWGVGDVAWTGTDGVGHSAEGAVHFGSLPEITRVVRDREGAVELAWDPGSVTEPEVLVRGPSGELVCGAGPTGTSLPWWAVPGSTGEVVLRSTRVEAGSVDGTTVNVRSTIERVVPMDRPSGTTAEEKDTLPPARPGSATTPRKPHRAPRSPLG